MRVYYDSRGRRRGYSLSGGEAEASEWAKVLFLAPPLIAAAFIGIAVMVVLSLLGVLLWSIGWLVSQRPAWAETGRRMRNGSKELHAPWSWLGSKLSPERQERKRREQANKRISDAMESEGQADGLDPQNASHPAPRSRPSVPAPPRPLAPQTDRWFNEIAVELADLGLTERARNTGSVLARVPIEGDIALDGPTLFVVVNVFATDELARDGEMALGAKPEIRAAVEGGRSVLRRAERLLYIANGRGRVVDEPLLEDVMLAVGKIGAPEPPAAEPIPVRSRDDQPRATRRRPAADL